MGYHTPQEEKEAPFVNNPDLIPVPVLASFSLDGKMIPVYFAVEGLKIKIDSVVWGKEGLAWGVRVITWTGRIRVRCREGRWRPGLAGP